MLCFTSSSGVYQRGLSPEIVFSLLRVFTFIIIIL